SRGNEVYGNFVGTDRTGANPLGNGETGIALSGTSKSLIGGPGAGQGNVISGNKRDGIYLGPLERPAVDNVIRGNWIGVANDGTKDPNLRNRVWGINFFLSGTEKNLVMGNKIEGGVLDVEKKNTVNDPNSLSGDGYGIYIDGTKTGSPV